MARIADAITYNKEPSIPTNNGTQMTGHPTTRTKSPTYKPPPPTRMPSRAPVPSRTYSSGGGGGVGANATGQVSVPVPSLAAFLGSDTGYQSQVAALHKALADYQAQMGMQKNQYNTNFAANISQLGTDRTQGMANQQNDYTSRGLLHSGLYGKAAGDLTSQFDQRQSDLERARADFLANLGLDYNNFRSQQNLTAQKAKQDAIARRAAKYGL